MRAGFSLAFIAALLLCLYGYSEERSGAELTDLAQQRRVAAEGELATFRVKQMRERQALVEKLQAAYRDLNAASEKARAAKTELAELTRNRAEFLRNEESYRFKYQALREELAANGGKSFDTKATPELLAEEVWTQLCARLAQLQQARGAQRSREEVILRDGTKAMLTTLRLGSVATYACGEDRNASGVCERTKGGTLRIVGVSPGEDGMRALRQAAGGEVLALPVDVAGTLATREDSKPHSWFSRLKAGGIFVYPILFCGLWGLVLVLERVRFFWRGGLPEARLEMLRNLLDVSPSHTAVQGAYQSYAEGRLAVRGLQAYEENAADPDAALETALMDEEPHMQRSLSMIAALSGVAPFLGLLGTVSGMIHTFSDIATFGAGNSKVLSGGISEALITTELGLMVAVPLLLAHAWLNSSLERRSIQLEQWAMEIVRRIKARRSGV